MPSSPSRAAAAASEQCVLVLQGGGALGAYQAGVYEALAERGVAPEWVAGVSIGAVNAALIAGNPPERRVERLRAFWDQVSSGLLLPALPERCGDELRSWFNASSAALVAGFGVPGFFMPRLPPAPLQPSGTQGALSWYDTGPMRSTLERLVDFDRINDTRCRGKVRLSVGAVELQTGNSVYFDSARQAGPHRFGPEHVMASGALPPGFAPVAIDGKWYWDGGVVSNTPLQYVIDQPAVQDMLVFQVDLFSARGPLPRNLDEVAERAKDIQYASRTRLNTDLVAAQQRLAAAAQRLADRLPAGFADDPDLQALLNAGNCRAVTVMHLIHRSKSHAGASKDYEFSRQTMRENWAAGRADVEASFADPRWQNRPRNKAGITVLDLAPRPAGR
ncbi:patatin-like phospholipase family protein [Pseudorhodoferax sp.]|uniref:patatin-like phospholipase family protein n=1 Tax=Pseudorhodoferax sp. TaxID=1993553 RepID=UPI0039E631FA